MPANRVAFRLLCQGVHAHEELERGGRLKAHMEVEYGWDRDTPGALLPQLPKQGHPPIHPVDA